MESAQRRGRLIDAFSARCGGRPAALARAPGRVNLIGEHLDYNGFPVLPMAIDRDVLAAWRPRADRAIIAESLDAVSDGPRRFDVSREIDPYPAGDWGNYAKAAAQGLVDRLGEGWGRLRGFEMLLTGNIPPSAGLSSSSALVVLFSLILLAASDLHFPPLELAELLAEAEKFVGTQGGGMDQASSLCGERGSALRIDFRPLRVAPIPVPRGFAFVVADTMVRAAKSESLAYNLRAAECRLAAAVAAARTGSAIALLGDLGCGREEREAALALLHPEPYSLAEIAALVGGSPQSLADRFLRQRDGGTLVEPPGGFLLYTRARHVLEEAARVEEACSVLDGGRVERLGALMDLSHRSCRDLFQISCPELEQLTALALENGALGSRLTGAGFGGCTVSLVEASRAAELAAALRRGYHERRPGPAQGGSFEQVFVCRPAAGADILPM